MRPSAVLVLALLACSALAASADVTLRGEVVELACATARGPAGRGDAHAGCAMECARQGLPMALRVDDDLYEIAGDFTAQKNAKLLDFVARQVEAKGELVETGGRRVLNVSAMSLVPPPKR